MEVPLTARNSASCFQPASKKLLSGKFFLGIGLIVLSFVTALFAKIVFFLYFEVPLYRNGSVVVYATSWLVMPVGVWLVGREYYDSIQKYTSLKHYCNAVIERTRTFTNSVLEEKSLYRSLPEHDRQEPGCLGIGVTSSTDHLSTADRPK